MSALRFAAWYLLLLVALLALREHPAGRAWIDWTTARPAAAALVWLAPQDSVAAKGSSLTWPQGRLGLLNGCDGYELFTLFAAAALAAPLAWRHRLALLGAGLALLWTLNQGRILALYASFRWQRDWFDDIHTLWGPLVLVLAGAALYACTLARSPRRS